jgi:hypothetical protein
MSELRQHLDRGQPVVVWVGSRGLPGHPPGEDLGEQPLVLIGATQSGFVYSDPSFSSSLGYGLQISEADLLPAWDAATRARQALAFVPRPRPLPRQAHIGEAEAPEPVARIVATTTPLPGIVRPTQVPTIEPPTPTPLVVAPVEPPLVADAEGRGASSPAADWSWTVLVGLGVIGLVSVVVRRWHARRAV